MDADSFIVNKKTEDIYIDIAKDIGTRFVNQTDDYLNLKKSKKVIGLLKGKLGSNIMTFAALRPKKYLYLTYDNDENKTVKGIKKCFMKRKLKFEDYNHRLEAAQPKIMMWIVLKKIAIRT